MRSLTSIISGALILLSLNSFFTSPLLAGESDPVKKIAKKDNANPFVVPPSNSDNGGHGIGNGEYGGGVRASLSLSGEADPRNGHGLGNSGVINPGLKTMMGQIVCLEANHTYVHCLCENVSRLPIILEEKDSFQCEEKCREQGLGRPYDQVFYEGSTASACEISEVNAQFADFRCGNGSSSDGSTIFYEGFFDLVSAGELTNRSSGECCRATSQLSCFDSY